MYKNVNIYKKIAVSFILVTIFTGLFSSCNKSIDKTIDKKNNIVQKKPSESKSENKSESKIENKSEVKQVKEENKTPKPIIKKQNKVIVIDPGHGNKSNLEKEPIAPGSTNLKIKDGGGAQGIVTRTPEHVINLRVSLKLKGILENRGYGVIMTKTEATQTLGNVARAEVGNKSNADLVVRIHADSSENTSVTGASMLIPAQINDETKKIYNESKRCGTIIIKQVTSEVGMKNRGVVERNDMTGFNWTKVPVILIEMGFLSNNEEDKLLSSETYENRIATAIANGIDSCFK